MTQPISTTSVTSFATELAELLINNETVQSDADRTTRDAARETFLKDAQAQVDALHAAASATENGAMWSAAFTIAGAGCSIAAADLKFDAATTKPCDTAAIAADIKDANILDSMSTGFSKLAPTADSMGGGRAADDDKVDAKHFETLAQQAQWQASDASTEIDKADKLGAKILDIVQSLNQAQDSATNAVIGRI
ncbi:MAG TPA: hypothetical protein VNW92_24430 [Polyangiaceae bacterium]|jgi:hypothetical protein|nr:hypothetical protein [Polyangiaceae bacterium]